MYFDRKTGRILLRDGTVLKSSFGIAKDILEDRTAGHDVKVMSDFHSKTYDSLNRTTLSHEVSEIYPKSTNHQHNEDDINLLLELIQSSDRWEDVEQFEQRVIEEITYFSKSLNIMFILRCYDLIQQFKRDKVLWGVGRGSSCASLVLYLLEITDVNPLKYNIPFYELSKERYGDE